MAHDLHSLFQARTGSAWSSGSIALSPDGSATCTDDYKITSITLNSVNCGSTGTWCTLVVPTFVGGSRKAIVSANTGFGTWSYAKRTGGTLGNTNAQPTYFTAWASAFTVILDVTYTWTDPYNGTLVGTATITFAPV